MQKTIYEIAVDDRLKSSTNKLDKIDTLINWEPISDLLESTLRNHFGATPYKYISMFKAMLLQMWYELSDPGLEESLRDRLSFMRFCGFQIDKPVPDHSTISRFRKKLIENDLEQRVLEMVNEQIEEAGFSLKRGTVVDASLVKSYSRPHRKELIEDEPIGDDQPKENNETDALEPEKYEINESKDPDARWIKKGKRCVYGYKVHAAVDINYGIFQGIIATPANVHDTTKLKDLLELIELEKGAGVLGDKGYSSNKNKEIIRGKGYKSFLMFKKYKNDRLKDLKLRFNQYVSRFRYIVERSFGTMHKDYGVSRTRYVGNRKTEYFFKMIGIAFNIKRFLSLKGSLA